MKRTFRVILALAMALMLTIGFVVPASALPGEQNGDALVIVEPSGGAYVIVTNLVPGDLDFNYGWNNVKAFDSPPVGYWVGVYDVTISNYVWSSENPLGVPAPKLLKLSSLDTSTLVSGHDYYINFFVRSDYGTSPFTNVSVITVAFTAP